MHRVVLRVPTAPQYSFVEFQLESETLSGLANEIDSVTNELIARAVLTVEVGFAIGKHNPQELADIAKGQKPEVAEADSDADAVETVKEQLPATVLEEYATPAPWEQGTPKEETRPAPPWAAAPTPVKSAPAGFDDF